MASGDHAATGRAGERPIALYAVVAGLSLALIFVSQSGIFDGDEGFHLLAARLTGLGKAPYRDFFYQHPPLFLYLTGAWLRLFGSGWRSAHALAALLTGGSIAIVAQYLYTRIPDRRWKASGAVLGAVFVGLHVIVLRFATIGRPFALSLFFMVAAFRLTILAAESGGRWAAAAAGATAGAALMSSLLTAPVAPVLLVWLLWQDRRPLRTLAHFLGGALVPALPVLWPAFQSPRVVFFDLVEFHWRYRRLDFPDTSLRGVRIMRNWFASSQGLLVLVPGLAGLLCTRRRTSDPARELSESSLCAVLVGTLALYLLFARPTFFEYFIVTVPFLSILAARGACELAAALLPSWRPAWLALLLIMAFAGATVRSFWFEERGVASGWPAFDEIARAAAEVTPETGALYASEAVCFASGRLPPPGLENPYLRLATLPPHLAALLHAVPQAEIDRQLAEGRFDTAVLWSQDPRIAFLGLHHVYPHARELSGHLIFWGSRTARLQP